VSAVHPLVLPRLGRAEARAARQRSAPRGALELPGIGGRLSVDTAGIGRCGPTPMCVALTWGGRSLIVRCARELLVRVLAGLRTESLGTESLGTEGLGTGLDIDHLAPDLAGLLLEASLMAALEVAENATREDIRFVSAEPETEPPPEVGLRLLFDDGERRWGLLVASVEADRDTVTDLLSHWPVVPWPAEQLPLPAALRLGTTPLTIAALRSLRPDDAVLLDRERHKGAMLVVAEAWLAEARRDGEAWRLDAAPRPARSRQDSEWTMQDGDAAMQDDKVQDDVAIGDPDELPVRLAFDVGRLDISLGELRRLDAGSILELHGSADALVRISVNGRLVGQGALVDINGTVGVRIVRMFNLG
jgi:type III secretion protein Q